jgi:hypothetical protein
MKLKKFLFAETEIVLNINNLDKKEMNDV